MGNGEKMDSNQASDSPLKKSLDHALSEKLRQSMKGYNWLAFFVMVLIALFFYVEFQSRGVLFWAGWLLVCQLGIAIIALLDLAPRQWFRLYSVFFVIGCLGWSLGPIVFNITELLSPISEKLYGILLLTIAATIQNPLSVNFRFSVYSISALVAPYLVYEASRVEFFLLGEQVIFVTVLLAGMIVLLARSKMTNVDMMEAMMLGERLRLSHDSLDEKRNELSELKKKSEEILDWDPLTGLYSTAGFWRRIDTLSVSSQGTALSVKMADMDHVRTTFGAGVVESLLKDMAAKLKSIARGSDLLCRAGATSFVAYFPDRVISRGVIRDVMEMPALTSMGRVALAMNIGVTYLQPGDGASSAVKVAISNADRAAKMKKEKVTILEGHSGEARNVELYSRLKFDLPDAIEGNQLSLVYQPQHRASDGEVIGFEALVRWEHPELGGISPATFIPLAEQAGLMIKLGAWVFDRALRDAKNRAIFVRGIKLSVNVSPIQLSSDYFLPLLQSSIGRHEVDPRNITLEITESNFMEDPEFSLPILKELKGMGFSIALDDFGTGYSSLSYLAQFPIDILKVDRSLVSKITEDVMSRTLFACILDMTTALRMPVVVEGVETKDQLRIVQAAGGDIIQGFLYSGAIPAGEMLSYTQKWNDGMETKVGRPDGRRKNHGKEGEAQGAGGTSFAANPQGG